MSPDPTVTAMDDTGRHPDQTNSTDRASARAGDGGDEVRQLRQRVHGLVERIQSLDAERRRLDRRQREIEADERQLMVELARLTASSSPDDPAEPHVTQRPDPVSPAEHELRISLLGPFGVRGGAGSPEVEVCGELPSAVLRYLAAMGCSGVHKERLADEFWPDVGPRAARRSLHQAVYTIRRALAAAGADDQLRYANDRYVLGGPGCCRDIDELEEWSERFRAARRDDRVAEAIEAARRVETLYRGDLLADHPYDEWATGLRQRYRALHDDAVAFLLGQLDRSGDHQAVAEVAERALAIDPAHEEAGRFLVRARLILGQRRQALLAMESLRRALAEIGLAPSAETERVLIGLSGR